VCCLLFRARIRKYPTARILHNSARRSRGVIFVGCKAKGRVISVGEIERAGGPELWKGPDGLAKMAIAAGIHAIFLAKQAKDQSYLRLLPA
jgi:hypothetical protein